MVNDQEMTRRVIHLALGQMPNVIVIGEAQNGWDAVDFVEADQPDVVVMDFRMPFMDGLEATARIAKSWPQVKVVMHSMTGVSRQAGKAVGACAVLRPHDSMKMLQTAVMDA
ncbi:MAG: response regulator transcription factor [Chloroflexi bacterium]|nr:response regulator transcription factor [Chloroflexota bacterium]